MQSALALSGPPRWLDTIPARGERLGVCVTGVCPRGGKGCRCRCSAERGLLTSVIRAGPVLFVGLGSCAMVPCRAGLLSFSDRGVAGDRGLRDWGPWHEDTGRLGGCGRPPEPCGGRTSGFGLSPR